MNARWILRGLRHSPLFKVEGEGQSQTTGLAESGGLQVGSELQGEVVGDVEIEKVRVHSSINQIQHIDDGGGGHGDFHIALVVFLHRQDTLIVIIGEVGVEQVKMLLHPVTVFGPIDDHPLGKAADEIDGGAKSGVDDGDLPPTLVVYLPSAREHRRQCDSDLRVVLLLQNGIGGVYIFNHRLRSSPLVSVGLHKSGIANLGSPVVLRKTLGASKECSEKHEHYTTEIFHNRLTDNNFTWKVTT